MTFRVGQKVICINDKCRPNREWLGDRPVKGQIYTITGFRMTREGEGLLFKEIKNIPEHVGAYDPIRFRPIVDRQTDISIFTDMLTSTRVDA